MRNVKCDFWEPIVYTWWGVLSIVHIIIVRCVMSSVQCDFWGVNSLHGRSACSEAQTAKITPALRTYNSLTATHIITWSASNNFDWCSNQWECWAFTQWKIDTMLFAQSVCAVGCKVIPYQTKPGLTVLQHFLHNFDLRCIFVCCNQIVCGNLHTVWKYKYI